MRVLHVIPSIAPRYGGPSYAVLGFCRALNARGVRTAIATTNADGEGVLPVPVGAPSTYEGVETRFFERRGEAFKYSPTLARWLRESASRFDLMHVHAVFSHSSLAAGRACRDARVPYIVRPLGSLDPWSLAQHAWRKRVMLWSAVGPLIRRAAGLHFTTDAERALAAPVTGRTPSAVIPLGVDAAFLRTPAVPPHQRDLRILALARLHPKKNLEALVRAFHTASGVPGLDKWQLTIAGSGEPDYLQRLRQAAARGPAAKRIEFWDWIDGDEKLYVLQRGAIFAVPSLQENFGLGALEAMACGLPVVLARGVNLAPDVAKAAAGWVTSDDEAGLASTLVTAMRDHTERARRSVNARALAERYSWDAAAARLHDWYAGLIARPVAAEGRR